MSTAASAEILVWGTSLPADRHLSKMLSFLGVPHATVDLRTAAADASKARLNVRCSITSATAIRHALSAGGPARDVLRKVFEESTAALIYGITPENVSPEELGSLADCATVPVWLSEPGVRYSVSARHKDVCGVLSGVAWNPVSSKGQVAALDGDADDVETLIAIDRSPVFVRHRRRVGELFLLCSDHVADLDEAVGQNLDVRSRFIDLFPYLMFLRYALPSACWSPGRPHGSLIIDDPPLRKRHGFLDFGRLVEAMDDVGFSSDIAFIPWNFKRTQPPVAALIKERPGRLGVCVHGCDHTAAEFGASDPTHLATLTKIGVERMEAHRRARGVDYEQIMVFPQGIFSQVAMEVLQSLNFLAAVNTEILPSENVGTPLTLADMLTPAITRYSGFPLFARRKCSDRLANFAADIFLGKPCLIVAHHTDFADGGRSLIELIAAIKATAPELQWSSLGTVLRRTYLSKRDPDGFESVRMYAGEITLVGEPGRDRHIRVLKSVGNSQRVEHVLVDARPVSVASDGDLLTIPIDLRPGQTANVRVVYRDRFTRPAARLGPAYQLRASLRRYLCDIRDNYVDVGRHKLRRHVQ